jgi:hypothetical protein
MKWDKIKSSWPYKKPKFWSVCNLVHRFIIGDWQRGLYYPNEHNCICRKCITWWHIKECNHVKALLGLRDLETGYEQWYCDICKEIYLRKG